MGKGREILTFWKREFVTIFQSSEIISAIIQKTTAHCSSCAGNSSWARRKVGPRSTRAAAAIRRGVLYSAPKTHVGTAERLQKVSYKKGRIRNLGVKLASLGTLKPP